MDLDCYQPMCASSQKRLDLTIQPAKRMLSGVPLAGTGHFGLGSDPNGEMRSCRDDPEIDYIDRLADAELRRRLIPPYRPDWELIARRHCGRRRFAVDRLRSHWWWQ